MKIEKPSVSGPAKQQVRAVFIGDSITHGVGDGANLGGWPMRVLRHEQAQGRNFTLYNLGIRSDTSDGISKRWKFESAARLPRQAKAVFVFSFGLNDATKIDGASRVPLERSLTTSHDMIKAAQALGTVLWVGPTPIWDGSQPLVSSLGITQTKSNAATAQYNAGFKKIATQLGVSYLDVFSHFNNKASWLSNLSDGVHPNATGYDAMAQFVTQSAEWRQIIDA